MKSPSKKLFNQLCLFWPQVEIAQIKYFEEINNIEKLMQKKTGVKDLEIFFVDNEPVGIGDYNRKMRLIHSEELNSRQLKKEK